eukprot:4096182-Pyramimonas_sp.AAC.2
MLECDLESSHEGGRMCEDGAVDPRFETPPKTIKRKSFMAVEDRLQRVQEPRVKIVRRIGRGGRCGVTGCAHRRSPLAVSIGEAVRPYARRLIGAHRWR